MKAVELDKISKDVTKRWMSKKLTKLTNKITGVTRKRT